MLTSMPFTSVLRPDWRPYGTLAGAGNMAARLMVVITGGGADLLGAIDRNYRNARNLCTQSPHGERTHPPPLPPLAQAWRVRLLAQSQRKSLSPLIFYRHCSLFQATSTRCAGEHRRSRHNGMSPPRRLDVGTSARHAVPCVCYAFSLALVPHQVSSNCPLLQFDSLSACGVHGLSLWRPAFHVGTHACELWSHAAAGWRSDVILAPASRHRLRVAPAGMSYVYVKHAISVSISLPGPSSPPISTRSARRLLQTPGETGSYGGYGEGEAEPEEPEEPVVLPTSSPSPITTIVASPTILPPSSPTPGTNAAGSAAATSIAAMLGAALLAAALL